MLPKRHKLSRTTFPHKRDVRSSWTGAVLRIEAYPPAPARADSAGGSDFGQAGKTNEMGMLPRCAVVVAKRSSDSAVMRNTFKRFVMEAVGRNMLYLRELPYQKYVILPVKHLRTINRENIVKDVQAFLLERRP